MAVSCAFCFNLSRNEEDEKYRAELRLGLRTRDAYEFALDRSCKCCVVGIVGKLRYEGPICYESKVIKWFTAWKPERPFPLDMAGFSFHLESLIKHPEARFEQKTPRGYLESDILTKLGLSRESAIGLADNCRSVLVWHTRTEKPRMDAEDSLNKQYGRASDLNIEV